MRNIFKSLFQSEKPISLMDMKKALQQVERDRNKSRIGIEREKKNSEQLFEKFKDALRNGDKLQEEYLLNDYKASKTEYQMLYSDARRSNLEGITLKRYIRLLEFAEKSKGSANSVIQRLKNSKLITKIDDAKINEQEYIQQLQEEVENISTELGFDLTTESYSSPEDEEIRNAAIKIIELEESGKFDEANFEKGREINRNSTKEDNH